MRVHAQQRREKRQFDEISSSGDAPKQVSKRRRVEYPPEFWDALSKIPLTRGALRELDRRTAQRRFVPGVEARRPAASPWLLRSDSSRLRDVAKTGGLDLSILRGYSNLRTGFDTMSKSSSQSQKRSRGSDSRKSGSTSKSKNTSPYDAVFQQMMIDQGVYPAGYRPADRSRPPKPNNLTEIRLALEQSRASLSPSQFSETAFEDFQDANLQGGSEARVMAKVVPLIAGSKDRNYDSAGDKLFNNMEKLHPNITRPKPDHYYGANVSQINSRVQDEIGQYIIPSTDRTQPAVPNCFLASKSSSGNAYVAQRQAMYDNTIGARAMSHLQNYGNMTPVYDGNAYTISSSYCDGQLKMYATHPSQPAGGRGNTQYYTTQIDSFAMTGNSASFRNGAAAYRNAREWAERQRNSFIAGANIIAERLSAEAMSFSRTSNDADDSDGSEGSDGPPGSDTSTDELVLNHKVLAKRRRGRLSSS